jgi:hypothetical protein
MEEDTDMDKDTNMDRYSNRDMDMESAIFC